MKSVVFALALAACSGGKPAREARVTPGEAGVAPTAERTAEAEREGAAGGVIERLPVEPVADGRDGVHGMIVFGGDDTWISHLPMFHRPHDVQLIARVTLAAADGPVALDGLHTIAPERFRLDDVIAGTRKTFDGELFRGNFEDGGTSRGLVEVTIAELVVVRPMGEGADDEWYVLGGGEAWWAVKRIGAAPSRDRIARVRLGAPVAGRYRGPLQAGAVLRGERSITVEAVDELSCLVGPDFTARCR